MDGILSQLGNVSRAEISNGLTRVNRVSKDLSFSDVLKARLEKDAGIEFSAHAVERLKERGINLSCGEINRLSGAVSRAEEKNASDSLILIDDMAFIVSIKNHTVVTAMTSESIKNKVFTNIDSTIIA